MTIVRWVYWNSLERVTLHYKQSNSKVVFFSLTTQYPFVEPPPPPSKKNDSSGHTRIKRALSTSIITRLHTLSKKDKKQNENTEKRDKKDKKKHRTKDKEKETKESNKRLAPSLAQIGKSSTIADIKYSFGVHKNDN